MVVDRRASRRGGRQPWPEEGSRSFSPAVKSETMTATSVNLSSSPDLPLLKSTVATRPFLSGYT
jgi:hypothetical protein